MTLSLGQIVYLKTDPEQRERIVTGITQRPGTILYHLSVADFESVHYEIEITTEKDILKSLNQ